MDYGKLLRRSWEILWEHKFLFLLGVLVALSSSGSSGFSSSGTLGQLQSEGRQIPEFRGPLVRPEKWGEFG
jgi:hypothetical protein